MKICFISREIFPFFYGGIGTQFYAQMKQIYQQGHEIFFITEKPENFSQTEFQARYQGIKVIFIERTLKNYLFSASLNYAVNVEKIFSQFCQEEKPELVFLSDYAAEGFFIFLKRLGGEYKDIPFLLELQGATYECLKYNSASPDNFFEKVFSENKIQCYMENFCIPLADYLVCPSEALWNVVAARIELTNPLRIIYNSINTEVFEIAEIPSKTKDIKTIVYAGRLEKRKGVDILIQSFIEILQENKQIDTELVLLGGDLFWEEYGTSFQNYWQQNIPDEIRDKIQFLGHCSQETLKHYYRNAWTAVFPSAWEPFGIVCLEAITMGCPAIVTKDSGLMEVVGKDYGIFFDRADGVEGLKSVLLKILQNVNLRNALAQKSLSRAKELFAQDGQPILEYIDLINNEFKSSVVRPRNAEILNLSLVFEEYDNLCRDKQEDSQAWIKELQQGKDWLESQSHNWQQKAEETQSKLEDSQAWIKELQQGKDWLESQFNNWQQKAKEIQSELEKAQAGIKELQQDKDWLESQFNFWRQKAEESQSELEKAQAGIKELQQDKDCLESQSYNWQQKAEESQSELEKAQAWIKELQQGKDWLESQSYNWQQKAEESQSELEKAQSIIQGMESSKFWKLRNFWWRLKRTT
jgi:glycosyltransferase involved in cell wall biosynthesis/peptidoglycan hydrolase CwlO-like protein